MDEIEELPTEVQTQNDLDQLNDELDAQLLINRTRWQYRVVSLGMFNAPDRMAAMLGHLGSKGWELITIYDKQSNWLQGMEKDFALFKRSVPAGEHSRRRMGAVGLCEHSRTRQAAQGNT
jgi:hypothetical protein